MRRVNTKAPLSRRRLSSLAALVACSILGASQALGASAETGAVPPAPTPFAAYLTPVTTKLSQEQVVAIARSEAAHAGEPSPTITVSTASLENAMRSVDSSTVIPEAAEPGERAMYATPVSLVVMHGAFTLQDAPVPPGIPAPKGSVFDVIIDEHTGAVMGRALPSPSDLAASLPLATTASMKVGNDGIIVGTLGIGGGPPTRRHLTRSLAKHVRVVVTSVAHTVVARTMTGSNGRFSVRIRPGHYLVAGIASQVCPASRVTVRPRAIVSTRLTCSIK